MRSMNAHMRDEMKALRAENDELKKKYARVLGIHDKMIYCCQCPSYSICNEDDRSKFDCYNRYNVYISNDANFKEDE